MLRLILLFVGYGNLLYGKSICTKEKMDTNQILGEVYGFIKPPSKEPKVVDKVEYLFDGKPIEEDEVIAKSQLYIECAPDRTPYDFDKPLPNGWLYPIFYEDQRWKKYFDTGTEEYWVFPNVYCNKKTRRLTAISWMRSGREGGQGHRNMHKNFKDHTPSHPNVDDEDGSKGVYCHWSGWLYPLGKESNNFFDTKDNQAFTIVNVYCRNDRVTYLHRAEHNGMSRFGDGIKRAVEKEIPPFPKNIDHPKETDKLVRCNWNGWLYKAMLLNDEWDNEEKKIRWTYERYFIVSNRGRGEEKKKIGDSRASIHGRVMNPYCSKAKPESAYSGVVTAIRAYCFYPSTGDWATEKKSMCDDLVSP